MHPIPQNETERLASVETYQIEDTPPEVSYDDIAELAAEICRCPVGMINIIGDTHEWIKAKHGLPESLTYLPRGTPCSTAICQDDLLTISDMSQDDRFADHPVVKNEPHFRFYSGVPLINEEGYALGTVCVFDVEPRDPNPKQLESLRRLSRQTMAHLELRRKAIELSGARQALLAAESRSNELLLNILPQSIAEELKAKNGVEPRYHESATIMFTDFKGFNELTEKSEARTLIHDLNQFFSAFDEIISRHNLEKIRTIGDAYMCVGGLPLKTLSHPDDVCGAALEIHHYVKRVNSQRERMQLAPWNLRIGLHTGPVLAGVVGRKKFTYDIWGEAVNIAALMASNGEAGRITISEELFHKVQNKLNCEYHGQIESKNKGLVETYFLIPDSKD